MTLWLWKSQNGSNGTHIKGLLRASFIVLEYVANGTMSSAP